MTTPRTVGRKIMAKKARKRGRPPKVVSAAERRANQNRARRLREIVAGLGWDYARLATEIVAGGWPSVSPSALRKYADGTNPMPLTASTSIAGLLDLRVKFVHDGEPPVSAFALETQPEQCTLPQVLLQRNLELELTRFEAALEAMGISRIRIGVARDFAAENLRASDLATATVSEKHTAPATTPGVHTAPSMELAQLRSRWYRDQVDALLDRIRRLV